MPETVDGIYVKDCSRDQVLKAVNYGSQDGLAATKGISTTLAGTIMDARPILSLSDLNAVKGVGSTLYKH